ncbi:DNA-binding LytR/AlgR family response regulator [Aequitasia blattaphilus]|uniref:Stage 0 sporulation protein A homolog n=1 Tax=Aequitasia blattaphilus TaxID=2949332 RepID=A0ABT1EAB6_9FIRM|nr:LytTR family DNA-binding domain-containing protein [Aequitasia blattaphilus]MCP1102785.1 LytTR family DNA-binding domain-containing protein [Aequitasia blattaphilus]MCR8615425.1 LytTR family DNA-binding domain-containing protein [Aequitasia blattaphilus]
MIRVAIVEDEKEYRDLICSYLKRYEEEQNQFFKITVFKDGLDIAEEYKPEYEIIFLDIQMKHLNGMEAAERIREFDEEVQIVFITSTVQYAVQGYQVNALGYIVKPLAYPAFSRTMDKVVKICEKHREEAYLTVKVEGGTRRISIRDILYVESQRHFLSIATAQEELVVRGSLKVIEEELKEKGFVRCHNAFLVNLFHVLEVQQNTVLLTGEREVSLSRGKRKAFLLALADYIGGDN